MAVNITTIQGDSINHTLPPSKNGSTYVNIPGYFNQKQTTVGFSEETLSKHTLLVGGTGCGKTNVFNYFVQQIKRQLRKDDVMIIFDTKGDFLRKFYRSGDVVISNSKAHADVSSRWNIYKEIVVVFTVAGSTAKRCLIEKGRKRCTCMKPVFLPCALR